MINVRELSLHILDVIENSLTAGATLIDISIVDDNDENVLGITIKDNGKGMDEESKENLFTEFYSTKGNAGTGLGLVVVDRIVQQNAGKIDVLTKAGTGSLFRVVFSVQ